jgi:hypothetical protein
MPKEFCEGCLSFQYPDNWELEREDNDQGWTVSLFSPGTAFLTLTLDSEFPEPDQMVTAVLEVMREEYPQLEVDETAEKVAGQWAVGHDLYFISLDLTNTCATRSFDTPDGTALLIWQGADFELPQLEPVIKAILESLTVAEDDETP